MILGEGHQLVHIEIFVFPTSLKSNITGWDTLGCMRAVSINSSSIFGCTILFIHHFKRAKCSLG